MSDCQLNLKEYVTQNNEVLLYTGNPNKHLLERLVDTSGDVWHSSLDQGFKNCFQDIIYQTAVYWWFLNDFEDEELSINWRINIHEFVIRKEVWEVFKNSIFVYDNPIVSGLDFGFNLLRYKGGVPLYVKGLFSEDNKVDILISKIDRYRFYLKNFKKHHSFYMLYRKGVFKFLGEYKALRKAKGEINNLKAETGYIKLRQLQPLQSKPTVSLVIPTMKRQEYAELLLKDHNTQTYLIKEAIIVDATPESERDDKYYKEENFKFSIKVKWQTTKGSCRARNEAIDMCTGDYIIFADDDIRIFPDFVENHLRFLQTYKANAANGLDIMAEHQNQNTNDLKHRLKSLGEERWKGGISQSFSNANSIVKRSVVRELIGNDINFDGGYGEDSDFGFRILKAGETLLHNPFSPNLHLKPPQGGYRFWGQQSRLIGKKRKAQPWELGKPVKMVRPIPSPTITYGIIKHFKKEQVKEWRKKHFFIYLFKGKKRVKEPFLIRLLKLPYKQMQFAKSLQYARRLLYLGPRYR